MVLFDSIFIRDYVDDEFPKNTRNFVYKYEELDIRSLSKSYSSNRLSMILILQNLEKYFVVENLIKFIPQLLTIILIIYKYNETVSSLIMNTNFFDYPVVATWEQAVFCHWRTHIMNDYLRFYKQYHYYQIFQTSY